MVNGRQAPYSVGMVYGDLADIMLHLGCVDAINLDGGGSSVFATQREGERNNNGTAGLTVRCRPSDGYERSVSTSLMVVSTAASDGVFDHATITPAQEIYTPNSTVQFSAAGIDKAGKPAPLPDGLTWTVASGDGVIDADGLYHGSGNEGVVRIELKNGTAVVGTAIIEQRWPDKLGFTNASISLDFGKSSDLTFNPTYKGQPIHYTATESGMHSITLGWAAAKGAPTYLIQQKMGEKWYKVGETSATSFTVDRLESQTEYEFRVNTRAVAGGTNYYSLAYEIVICCTRARGR